MIENDIEQTILGEKKTGVIDVVVAILSFAAPPAKETASSPSSYNSIHSPGIVLGADMVAWSAFESSFCFFFSDSIGKSKKK